MSALEKAWEILERMGLIWPDGDEGKLRDAAKAWRAFAKDAEEVQGDTNHSAQRILEVNSGEGVDAFETFWSRYVGKGEKGWLRSLPEAARDMAKMLDELADDIDGTKKQIRSEIVGSAAVIAAGIVLTGPTLGASDAAAVAAATGIVTLSIEKSTSLATRAAALVMRIARGAVFAGVSSVAMDLAVAQPARILAGQQDGISLEEVSNAAKYGTLTGAVLGPFAPGPGARPPMMRPPASLREKLIPGKSSRPTEKVPGAGEPVDVATGAMFMQLTDLSLPASLPLHFTRTHVSSYRAGVCFGPSWSSTLDEQVQLDPQGVVFAAADGMRLVYPVPEPGVPLLPEKGPRWPLEWDGKPDGVLRVTDPDSGVTRTFAHPGPTQDETTLRLPVESWQDRNGARIEVERDAAGIPSAVRHSGGYHLALETEGQRVTALRLLDEAPSPYEREQAPAPGTLVMRYGYDEAGNLTEVINSSGQAMRFTYDGEGRMLSWTDRNGVWCRFTYDEAGRTVRTAGTDGIYNDTFTYDDTSCITTYIDSHGHRTVFRYNDDGQVVEETDPLENTTHTEWDARGHDRLSHTDELGRTTRYTYDNDGNLAEILLPDGSHVSATYNHLRQPTTVTDPGGARWQHAYDELGNLTRHVDPTGAATSYAYNARGHLTSLTDALGHTRHIGPNPAGLPATVTDALGHTTHISRDTFGRVTEITDPLGHVTRMAWTVEGKPRWREDAAGGRENWTWDAEGNLLTHTDPAGHTTRHTPGPWDMPVSREDADGAVYSFTYDSTLRLTRVTNPQGRHWDYAYDAAGRLISETDFNGAVLTYAVDPAGRLTARTNAAGQTLRFTHDALGRLTEQHDEDADTVTTYGYSTTGDLVRASGPDADMTLTRDAVGRVLSERVNERTTTFAYDLLGRCTRRTTPSGLTSTWTHDAEGQPAQLATEHGALSFIYDAVGRETERRTGDVVLTQQWDAADRVTRQTAHTASALLQHRDYTYRPDGHLTEIRELTSGTRRFDLDGTGRVTGVHAHGWRETYAYDAAGNLTSAEAPDHPAPGERTVEGTLLHRAGRTAYAHDAAGRRISKTVRLLNGQQRTWTYTWNAEDRLSGVTTPDGAEWTYTYDPLGRRVSKHGPDDEAVVFAWDGTRVAERTASDGRTTTWDYAPDTHRPVAQTDHTPLLPEPGSSLLTKLTGPTGTRPRFQAVLTDQTGTPTELISPTGEVTWRHRTTLWGTPLPRPTVEGTSDCPLRFPGQYADPETGLNYNYFRYYDPETARYLTPDPLGLVPAPNPTTYVKNALSEIDPLGLAGCGIDLSKATPHSGRFPKTANPDEILVRRKDDGTVTAYAVYDTEGKTLKRVDVDPDSKPHAGIPAPHVLETEKHVNPKTGEEFRTWKKMPRPARPDELPPP
ncbi:DUF6531 domain-containing protein [Streptomyces qinglanensis]|uniref:RHS repeat-associated core domain-containing protein n=1 Tax=Streptomyces qinglanensis TaxID=943816 RepID=A0A1H9RZL2_9ACTN|nr:DUF6531 domain-containing protein [Streptomyces qinglanensis]SER77553.1 RHS repeat-associated core domain-containing protein [Streptomyces qinglanensis]